MMARVLALSSSSGISQIGLIIVVGMPGNSLPSVLAVNRLEDSFSASPALVDREFYLRGERFLYCLAE